MAGDMASKKELKRRLRRVEAELADLRQISAGALMAVLAPPKWPDDYTHVIECPNVCGEDDELRTEDHDEWQRLIQEHYTRCGHQPKAYSIRHGT